MSLRSDRNRSGNRQSEPRDGYSPYGQRSQQSMDIQDSDDFLKVSSTSNVKSVAGKIAHTCRAGDIPAILATGAPSINQAIKAISIARTYLADDSIDIAFQPAFLDPDRTKPALALYLANSPRNARLMDPEVELSVSGQSSPQNVAGALAARIREGKSVCLTAIGLYAVANAVLAVGNARVYLEDDRLDVRVLPEFVKVTKDNAQMSAIKLNIITEEI